MRERAGAAERFQALFVRLVELYLASPLDDDGGKEGEDELVYDWGWCGLGWWLWLVG